MRAGGRFPGLTPDAGDEQRSPGRDPADAHPGAEEEARFAALLRGPAAAPPPGAAVLAGMGAVDTAATDAAPGIAAQLVEAMAERLLVSDGEGGGEPGVTVLATDVGIPGLEVSVRREAGGLVVELLADQPADLALLRGGAAELVGRLEARFGTRAEVRVLRRGAGRAPDRPE